MEEHLNTDKYYSEPALDQSNGYVHEGSSNDSDHIGVAVNNGSNSNNSSGNFAAAAAQASNAESEQMKIFVTNPNVTYHTRHARRIYVGGIPPNYSDEEELRNFFNKVISKGLDIDNDNTYVISVYMNQKKCYAFVEFNSIELTTACLEMDGIIFKKVTLKIYRANEYRPELVPPTKLIKLDLSGWSFGLATGAGAASGGGNPSPLQLQHTNSFMGRPQVGSGLIAPHASWIVDERVSPTVFHTETLSSLIQFTNIAGMEPGSVAIVGFPYESSPLPQNQGVKSPSMPQRNTQRGVGTATAPTCLRKCISAFPYGAIYNAELGIDLSQQPMVDVGDVLAGQSRGETKALLSTTVSELLLRGSVPFLVGGSRDQTYYSAMGLVAAAGVCVGVVNVSAQVDAKILDSSEFCTPSNQISPAQLRQNPVPGRNQNCFGRYVQFGAQGSQSNGEVAKSITDRGGHIFWLHKDLRAASTESVAIAQFTRALRNLDACVMHDQQRKGTNTAAMRASYPQSHMMVTVDCGVLASAFNPHGGSSVSSVGLTAEELLEIAFLAGAHPNVAMFELTEFRPDLETESRLNMFLVDMFYKFALGVASRSQPVRGGVLGAGSGAVLAAGHGVSSSAAQPTGSNAAAQFNRPLAVQNLANKQRVPVPYAPDMNPPRYAAARDPSSILQQQQQQQQQQLGRGPYTPQQLQQQAAHQQMARSQRGGLTPFPTIPENLAVNSLGTNNGSSNNLRTQLKHFTNQSGSPYQHQRDEESLNVAALNSEQHAYHLHLQDQQRQQRNSIGSYGDDESVASYGSSIMSRGNQPQPQRQSGQQTFGGGEGGSYQSPNQNQSLRPLPSAGNHSGGNHASNAFYQAGMQPQQQNSPSQTAGQAALNGSNISSAPAPWMYTPPSSYNGATPSSLVTASQPFAATTDWLNPNLSRLSSHSTSTMSMLGAFHSNSSNLHTNSFSNGNNNSVHNMNSSSFLLPHGGGNHAASSTFDDPMDKLLGVTNIGLVPAFDDPQDPLYGEE